jgi:hypothetical protein
MSAKGIKIVEGKEISGLRVEHYIDASTGITKSHFLLNGAMIPKVRLKGKFADQMTGLAMILKDLNSAKKWIQKAYDLTTGVRSAKPDDAVFTQVADEELFDEVKAFFIAGVTFYGKSFTEAQGRKIQFQRDWLAAEYREIHDRIMHLRHNLAAHSGDEKLESADVSLLLISQDKRSVSLQPTTTRAQPSFADVTVQGSDFLKLLTYIISIVIDRHYAAGQRLMAAVNEKPVAFWYMAAQGNVVVDLDDSAIRNRRRK